MCCVRYCGAWVSGVEARDITAWRGVEYSVLIGTAVIELPPCRENSRKGFKSELLISSTGHLGHYAANLSTDLHLPAQAMHSHPISSRCFSGTQSKPSHETAARTVLRVRNYHLLLALDEKRPCRHLTPRNTRVLIRPCEGSPKIRPYQARSRALPGLQSRPVGALDVVLVARSNVSIWLLLACSRRVDCRLCWP